MVPSIGATPPSDGLAHLLERPDLFLRELDLARDRALFTPMDEAGYRASSFLDSRAQRAAPREAAMALGSLVRHVLAGSGEARPLHFLFHIGHCGSTLISRLLGELPGVFALREPPPLLMLAQIRRHLGKPGMGVTEPQWEMLLQLVLRLLTRTYRSDDIALIKPMSHVNNLLAPLLDWHPGNRGVFLFLDLEAFLAAMLKPRNRSEAARAVRESRWVDFCRIAGLGEAPEPDFSDGERVALIWLVQMAEYHTASADARWGPRLMPVHFEDFLAEPARWLDQICVFLGRESARARVADTLAGPLLHSYSKAPGSAYDARAHAQELAATARTSADEIARGMAWAQTQADRHPAFAASLQQHRDRRVA